MRELPGRLIALEGIDKCGKRTQANLIKVWLESLGRKVRLIAFPDYDTPIGSIIRDFLHGKYYIAPEVRQLLYAANRWERKTDIISWLSSGHIVIADRYIPSGLAYGMANNLSLEWMTCLERGLPEADLVIIIDVPVEVSLRRLRDIGDTYERNRAFLTRVRNCYIELAEKFNWIIIDGNRSREEVFKDLQSIIVKFLNLNDENH